MGVGSSRFPAQRQDRGLDGRGRVRGSRPRYRPELEDATHLSGRLAPDEYRFRNERNEDAEILEGVRFVPAGAFMQYWNPRYVGHLRPSIRRVKIPSTVEGIGARAFQHSLLDAGELSDGLERIGDFAFQCCRSLTLVEIPASVKEVGAGAFEYCLNLEEVEGLEGLEDIGLRTFDRCLRLRRVRIPSNVLVIGCDAFRDCQRLEDVELCAGLEEIGRESFCGCSSLQSVAIPSTVEAIGEKAFGNCARLMTVELGRGSEGVDVGVDVGDSAFRNCFSLRNLALPTNVRASSRRFGGCYDLLRLFGSQEKVDRALRNRFDGLPVHRLCYYQSCESPDGMVEQIKNMAGPNQNPFEDAPRDCLGMTPLHILACSGSQNIDVYRIIVDRHPDSLVAQDKWGCVPMLYSIWIDAPDAVMQFLVKSQTSAFPDNVLNWDLVVETLCRAMVPIRAIERLIELHRTSFPGQNVNWQKAARELTTRCLLQCDGIAEKGKCDIYFRYYPFRDFQSSWESTMGVFYEAHVHLELRQGLLEIQQCYFPCQSDEDWRTVCEELVEPLRGWWRSGLTACLNLAKDRYSYESLMTFRFLAKCNMVERLGSTGPTRWQMRIKSEVGTLSSIPEQDLEARFDDIQSEVVTQEQPLLSKVSHLF